MTRRICDLTLQTLPRLPEPCRSCVFWESATGRRGDGGQDGAQGKEAWVQSTQLEWGAPGKAIMLDGELAAYGLLAPGGHFGRTRRQAHVPSADALLLATLWVAPDARGAGLATVLVQALLRETAQHGGKALEAYGSRGADPRSCVVPAGFLLAQGFTVLHEHATFPLLRLDLSRTARWRESLSHAVESVASALARRERSPVPAGRPT